MDRKICVGDCVGFKPGSFNPGFFECSASLRQEITIDFTRSEAGFTPIS
jgi:hypothetical protein